LYVPKRNWRRNRIETQVVPTTRSESTRIVETHVVIIVIAALVRGETEDVAAGDAQTPSQVR
jgi:hypothetical protein